MITWPECLAGAIHSGILKGEKYRDSKTGQSMNYTKKKRLKSSYYWMYGILITCENLEASVQRVIYMSEIFLKNSTLYQKIKKLLSTVMQGIKAH